MAGIDVETIKDILISMRQSSDMLGFLADQEADRLSEVLKAGLARVSGYTPQDYNAWAARARESVARELNDAQMYFGFSDFVVRFPLDDFLYNCYKVLTQ